MHGIPPPFLKMLHIDCLKQLESYMLKRKWKKMKNVKPFVQVKLGVPQKLRPPKNFGCHLTVFPCNNHTWPLKCCRITTKFFQFLTSHSHMWQPKTTKKIQLSFLKIEGNRKIVITNSPTIQSTTKSNQKFQLSCA